MKDGQIQEKKKKNVHDNYNGGWLKDVRTSVLFHRMGNERKRNVCNIK